MTNKMQRHLWLLLAVLFATCLTIFALSHIVTEPWHILPDIGGDGAKNNFTYLYHSMYGSGYWFTGMNYPYGEHILFTDGMPLLSVFFASIGNVHAGTALTACWWLLGISYVLSIVYLYKTLIFFRVTPIISVAAACLIGILTPQLICIRGHYALAFPCVVPMLFYWSILYNASGKLKYCLWIFIMGCLASFLHPYYAGMMLVWAGAYSIGYLIFTKARTALKLKHTGILLAAVAGVVLTVALIIKLTDPTRDRPVTPFTPPESYTHIKQIVTSDLSPAWHWLTEKKLKYKPSDGGEGFTYSGMVTIITVLLFGIYVVLKKISGKASAITTAASGFSPVWVFMALGILAFSMGIPFIWHMQWLMKYISFFKQFRALGRFSWIFYYIITIYSVVILHSIYSFLLTKGKKAMAYAMMIVLLGFWSFEASGYVTMTRELARQSVYHYDVIFSANEQSWTAYLDEHHYKATDFQAILALKFFHIGSEKLWVGDGSWTITLASRAAMQLHLPIVDVMMSRSSWAETKMQVRIAGGPYTDKPLLSNITGSKPFLLMHFDEDSLDADQKYLLASADYIGHYSQCYVYACYPQRLAANDKKYDDEITALMPYLHEGDTCIRGKGSWYVNHYDAKWPGNELLAANAFPCIKGQDSVIAVIPVKPVGDSQLYELSAWFLLHSKDYSSPEMYLQMKDSTGTVIGKADMNVKQSVDNYHMFFRGNAYFWLPAACRSLSCRLKNSPDPSYISMDELMLRPAEALIISTTKQHSLMVNNHLFHPARQR